MATLLNSNRLWLPQLGFGSPIRRFSASTRLARRMPQHRYGLTDAQLAEFGGKKSLQRRLVELDLSPIGFRAVLRQRMREYVLTQKTQDVKE
jgi:hypothetical protein